MAARSIRRELVGRLALGLLAAVVVAAAATYVRAREEANALFDYQLAQMAASITGMPLGAQELAAAPGAGDVVIGVWSRNGVELYHSQPWRSLPQAGQQGFTTIATGDGEWRVFSVRAGDQVVQVAQPMRLRRELAASMALSTILPLLAVVPFLALFVWFGIARSLAPLERLGAAVRRRSPETLAPLAERDLPLEVQPLVQDLNGLLARLATARDAQRAFIADAAHELRTPLTAVHLQAQLAERAADPAERATALAELRAGLDRATHLVGQLLTLAREEPDVATARLGPVDLAPIAQTVIGENVAQAAARGLDLGLARDDGAVVDARGRFVVAGDAASLRTLLNNLVDNALRYTPAGGRIDVALAHDGDAVLLSVRDSGPGIPEAEQPRVFDRFYRAPGAAGVPGSGLGLAIVKRIAERHGAAVTLGPGLAGTAGPGLGVTVRFRLSAAT